MEAERRKNRSAAKRTPLSDLTNTPIVDRSSAKTQIAKPYNSSLRSNTKLIDPNPSKSDSSIGSSNINNVPNPRISRAPQPLVSPPEPQPRSSSPNHHNRDGSEPLVIYSRTQTTKKSNKSKGDDSVVPYTDPSLEKTRGKEKEVSSALGCNLVEKAKDERKGIFLPFSFLSSVKTKAKAKAIAPGHHNLEEIEERGATVIQEAQSCPPQKSRRNSWGQFNEALDSLQPKLHTDPRPTKKKRLHSSQEDDFEPVDLPQDFVEQQRAYFKEVDDFELLEEEVSDKWLDEEEKPNSSKSRGKWYHSIDNEVFLYG